MYKQFEKAHTPTKAIRNAGNILILKFLAINKISSKLKIGSSPF